MTYKFNSKIKIGFDLPNFTEEQIKNEPMLFNCTFHEASKSGGPITKAFIEHVDKSIYASDYPSRWIVDTRVHMLMLGWYPCIPGYHHDDVPRSRSDGQPNYDTPEYNSKHVMALINGDICPTQFAVGQCEMPDVPLGEIIYKKWHTEVCTLIAFNKMKVINVPSNKLIWFDNHSFHQGQAAIKGGWRWFGRISFNTHRKPTNEIRRQVQVYLVNPMEGW